MLKFLLFLLSLPILAQTNAQTVYVTAAPSGSCSARTNLRLLTPQGTLYSCQSGIWGTASSGGGTPGSPVNSIQFNNAGAFGGFGSWTDSAGVRELGITGGANQINSTNGLFHLMDEHSNLVVYMNPSNGGGDNALRTYNITQPAVTSGAGIDGWGVSLETANGGATSDSMASNAGIGGAIYIHGGNGGIQTAGAFPTSGTGGGITLLGGNGANASVAGGGATNGAGNGASLHITAGTGGNATGAAAAENDAGSVAGIIFGCGQGGNASGGTLNAGGSSGVCGFTLFPGGTGSTSNGNAGEFHIDGASTVFKVTYSGGVTASALPTSAGAGGLFVCVDNTGVLYKKAVCP